MTTAAILLSRQPLCPTGQTRWVERAVEAVAWVGQNGFGLYTSVGMQTWEMLVTMAAKAGVRQQIVIPLPGGDDYDRVCGHVRQQFALDSAPHQFLPLYGESAGGSSRELMVLRDRFIAARADVLIPLSIRKNGNIAGLLREFLGAGRPIETRFQIEFQPRTAPLGYSVPATCLTEAVRNTTDSYITHWTRAAKGPWPDERCIDYYSSVLSSSTYPRTALDTLTHIVESGTIAASPRHMPSGTPCVCFSGLPPVSFVPLMRWRSRYTEMSFEPYGIGIARDSAFAAGIRPVLYNDGTSKRTGTEPVWHYQSRGTRGSWEQENEYRHAGDFHLHGIPREKMVCFCRSDSEAVAVTHKTGVPAIAFFSD